MSVLEHANAPGGATGGEAKSDQVGAGSVTTLPSPADVRPAATLPTFTPEDAAAVAGGAFVVVVHLFGERHKRRVYLSLASGHAAQVILSRLDPVGHVSATGSPVTAVIA